MSKLFFIVILLVSFVSTADNYIIQSPIYSILGSIKMKDPLEIYTACTLRCSKHTIGETFRDALEANGPYAQGTSPSIYTILEYHIELGTNQWDSGYRYYCFSYTKNDNIKR